MTDHPQIMETPMQQASFDTDRANALIQKIGYAIAEAEQYGDYEWAGISLVVNLHNRTNMYGYVYTADDWEAQMPGFDVLDLAEELQAAMQGGEQGPWKKCLIRIARETGKIDIDFDYDGDRWTPDMADPASFALSLKPGTAQNAERLPR